MKKRIICDISTTITLDVDIPDHLVETFEKYDEYDYYTQRSFEDYKEQEEIYEILNDQICNNIDDLEWSTIKIYDEI